MMRQPKVAGMAMLSGLWVGALYPTGEGWAQQEGLLYRSDEHRSAFAGSQLDRIQSYGSPVRKADGEKATEAEQSPEARSARVPERLPIRRTDGLPTSVGKMPAQAQGLPSQIYKSVPFHGVYLNGTNIVGLRSQTLRNVSVRFDEQGNIFIDAPHYDIRYDSSYHPLLPSESPALSKEGAPLPSQISPSLDVP